MKVLAINCKSNGFNGVIYLIAAIVLDQEKNVIDEFYGQIPDCFITDKESINTIKKINRQPNYNMRMEMIMGFSKFYKKYEEVEIIFKTDFLLVSRLFQECLDYNLLKEKNLPCLINNNKKQNTLTEINSLLFVTKKESDQKIKDIMNLSIIRWSIGIYSPIDNCKEMCSIYIDILNQRPEIVE